MVLAGRPGRDAPGQRATKRLWPARTRTVRPVRRLRTATAPAATVVRVPAKKSSVSQRVPRTGATEPPPRVWKRPWWSLPHRRRIGLRFLTAALWATAAVAARAGRGELAQRPPRSTTSVIPRPPGRWRTSKIPPQKRPVCVVPWASTALVRSTAPRRASTCVPVGSAALVPVSAVAAPPGARTKTAPETRASATLSPSSGAGASTGSAGAAGVAGLAGSAVDAGVALLAGLPFLPGVAGEAGTAGVAEVPGSFVIAGIAGRAGDAAAVAERSAAQASSAPAPSRARAARAAWREVHDSTPG